MTSLSAFIFKEWTEYKRTYRLFLLLIVLVLFAIISPATAYFMADILESAGIDVTALSDPSLANPTYLTSFEQFFKNLGQMGMLVMAIIFAGFTANDISKQTIVPLLAKGLKRDTVVIAKLISALLLWSLGFALSVAIMLGYTAYYFDIPSFKDLVLPLMGLYEFGLIIIALLGAGGTIFKSQAGSLATVGVVILLLTLINVFLPQIEAYNPMTLIGQGVATIAGAYEITEFITSMLVGAGVIITSAVTAILSFRRVQFQPN